MRPTEIDTVALRLFTFAIALGLAVAPARAAGKNDPAAEATDAGRPADKAAPPPSGSPTPRCSRSLE